MGDLEGTEAPGAAAERRLRQLEALYLGGPLAAHGQSFSVESLIDIMLVLYDECCNSSLRKEKTVSDFLEYGMSISFNHFLCEFEGRFVAALTPNS